MKIVKRFRFTTAELRWLYQQANNNELAGDIVTRYSQQHGKRERTK